MKPICGRAGNFPGGFRQVGCGGCGTQRLARWGEITDGAIAPSDLDRGAGLPTLPWGYAAREIIEFLVRAKYRWFGLCADGALEPVATDLPEYDANLVALPDERVAE